MLKAKLETIISGYKINKDDANWLRALLERTEELESDIASLGNGGTSCHIHQKHIERQVKGKWSNGDWSVETHGVDFVRIIGPYDQVAVLHGGDFESTLSGLCATYNCGRRNDS